ncbi:MAG TPA: transporter, partial [Rhodocyclaceae bacterium]|nr:transporter [Rhodocyclaceae bacterium]
MKMRRSALHRTAPFLLAAAMLPLLPACVPVAAVGVSAGALMIADRRPSETYITDEGIEIRAANRINE